MSHYTSIKTKYTDKKILKDVIRSIGLPYTEDKCKKQIEVFTMSTKKLSYNIYDSFYPNYLLFQFNNDEGNYDIITDPQAWTQKRLMSKSLKHIEMNYGYSETISQAIKLGFTRSKVISGLNNTKFIFQRCVEINT
uniref:hypothetical protein n=1 Tax=Phaeostrophion irregulare TaxID=243268 RepID=UPI002E75F5E9|nr:hypothetical protein V2492_pgp007 [Phaeostrophion irregulare]WAM64379.1 hypothetical protein [Phaeostrophion irregulare]